jgi:Dehydrogenase E1 component
MATLYKLPCIFVVENNKWAIGMSHARATGVSGVTDTEPHIYKKGPAFGMPGAGISACPGNCARSWCRNCAPSEELQAVSFE